MQDAPLERVRPFPREPGFDSTLALLKEGCAFISRRCDRFRSEAFETRLMLRPVVCTRGVDAAAMFYHPDRFTRRGAIPPTPVAVLQDAGSVQQLEGPAHRHRKQMFLDILGADSTARLGRIAAEEWRMRTERWPRQEQVVLREEAEQVMCRAACRWAGVALADEEVADRAGGLVAMIESRAISGPRLVSGMELRRRTKAWLRSVVGRLRAEGLDGGVTPAQRIAVHRELDGRLLDDTTAAVELISLLGPMVAVARWITFAALALHRHPHYRHRMEGGEPQLLLHFVQEVRRFYPLVPIVGGRVAVPFSWRGRRFRRGEWVLLDLYGTNHDARLWDRPERFNPDRFRNWQGSEFEFVPQGAGDVAQGHRCPAENPSIALVMAAVRQLVSLHYHVPEQDLEFRLDRFSSTPESGVVLCNVRALGWSNHAASGPCGVRQVADAEDVGEQKRTGRNQR